MENLTQQLKEEASKITSGSFADELKSQVQGGVVKGGLIFGGVAIAYAMFTNKNTFLFGIAGFVTGIIMASIYNRIEKITINNL